MAAPIRVLLLSVRSKSQVKANYARLFNQRYSTGNKRYDLVVIGGGSGGLACSKEAAALGKQVAVLDFVTPSPRGTKWGLGGTCVNVGCIPKKLMHHSAMMGQSLHDARKYGWDVPENISFSWEKMVQGVQNHVKSLNWGHRVQLKEKNVDYFNARGYVMDPNTVKATDAKGEEVLLETDNIVLAVGGRPRLPKDIPGALDHCITSDDIFWMKKPPGKTLVVGASYVALECAGFLTGLGYDVSVMVRSIILRNFDQQMSKLISQHMEEHGTRLLKNCVPMHILKEGDDIKVTWRDKDYSRFTDHFDSVMFAVGRDPVTRNLGLQNVGVKLDLNGYVIGGHGGDHERSSVPNIYAIGDILQNCPELTPVAIKSGRMLANRLFTESKEAMHYDKVPTTVFTPLEYGCVGLSEEKAVHKFGDSIEVYHSYYKPLEYSVPERSYDQCYIKMICQKEMFSKKQRVLGLHFLGPNAGEVVQGFSTAINLGVTREDIANTIAIHPTNAEEIVKMHITKRSGLDPHVTGC